VKVKLDEAGAAHEETIAKLQLLQKKLVFEN